MGVPNEAARMKILQAISSNLRLEGNFDFLAIAKKTPGFVGADLQAVSKEAASHAINRIFAKLEEVLQYREQNLIHQNHTKNVLKEDVEMAYINDLSTPTNTNSDVVDLGDEERVREGRSLSNILSGI